WALVRAGGGAIVYAIVMPALNMTPAAWIEGGFQVVFAAGIIVLLYQGIYIRRRILIGVIAVVFAWIGVTATEVVTAVSAGSSSGQIQRWALQDRAFTDEKDGVRLDLPDGWVMLATTNPIVSVPDAKMVATHQRSGCFAALIVVPVAGGEASLDDYLDV